MKNDEDIREKVRLAVVSSFKAISFDFNKKQVDIDNALKNFNFIDNDQTILEKEPLERLVKKKELAAFKHSGFWQCMDTPRDLEHLENKFRNIS